MWKYDNACSKYVFKWRSPIYYIICVIFCANIPWQFLWKQTHAKLSWFTVTNPNIISHFTYHWVSIRLVLLVTSVFISLIFYYATSVIFSRLYQDNFKYFFTIFIIPKPSLISSFLVPSQFMLSLKF